MSTKYVRKYVSMYSKHYQKYIHSRVFLDKYTIQLVNVYWNVRRIVSKKLLWNFLPNFGNIYGIQDLEMFYGVVPRILETVYQRRRYST